jgi:hypothetical protein
MPPDGAPGPDGFTNRFYQFKVLDERFFHRLWADFRRPVSVIHSASGISCTSFLWCGVNRSAGKHKEIKINGP